MAKINGTSMLLYCDGTVIAAQKNCTVSWEQDLIDTTTKDSAGWEEHINGMRRCTCDFDSLYSTTGLSAEALITYITGRTSCVLLIDGGGFPIIGEARPKNLNVSSPMEDASAVAGAFTFDGPAWMLTGDYANMMTDPDGQSTDYDTFTVSGIKVTSAINLAGEAFTWSNGMSIVDGGVYKVITFFTLNSGELPTVKLHDVGGVGTISNEVSLDEGVNIITLTATDTIADAHLLWSQTAAANWSTSNIYVFKV